MRYVIGLVLAMSMLTGTVSADPISTAVFHVNFGNDSVNDINGAVSSGTAQNITFVDTPLMAYGNGRGAYFNGVDSGINYGLGANNELKIEGALTYHIRALFARTTSGEQFLMGRFDSAGRVTYMQEFFGQGAFTTKFHLAGGPVDAGHVSPEQTVVSGQFYDIFFRFQSYTEDQGPGLLETLIYSADTGELIWKSPTWQTTATQLAELNTPFWVGLRGGHGGTIPFQGVIEQVNVWNRCISMTEVLDIVTPLDPISTAVFHVNFGSNSVNDLNGAISTGTAYNITFVNTPPMPHGNGRGAYFNGVDSGINYGLGANNELKIEGGLTYHIRALFSRTIPLDPPNGEQFLMGRFDSAGRVTYMQEFFGQGAITTKFNVAGDGPVDAGHVSPNDTVVPGKYYDIFFRFQPYTVEQGLGFFETAVYDTSTGEEVWKSPAWNTNATALEDLNTPFWVGLRGGLTGTIPFQGIIEQINVWDRCISMTRVLEIVTPDGSQNVRIPGDINRDSIVDLSDLALMASRWQDCIDPDNPDCANLYAVQQVYVASERWHRWIDSWKGNGFPLMAWGYFHRYAEDPGFDVYKDANLTMVMVPPQMEPDAAAAGLRTALSQWDMNNNLIRIYNNYNLLQTYIDYPPSGTDNVTGYMIMDEPTEVNLFRKIGISHNVIYVDDAKARLPMVNLLKYPWSTGYANYADYVQQFIDNAHPAVLNSTCYVLYSMGDSDLQFYNNYEVLRRKAMAYDIGLFGFVLCTEHGIYREVSESDIFWQVYTLLAHGAKGIFYYNYRISDPGFADGLVTSAGGVPTPRYYYVQSANSEVLNLASVLLRLESKGVYHAGGLVPVEGQAYSAGAVTGLASVGAGEFIVSEFEHEDVLDNDVYVMVVNKRHAEWTPRNDGSVVQTFTFSVSPEYGYVYRYDATTGAPVLMTAGGGGSYAISLNAGGVLLRLSSESLY